MADKPKISVSSFRYIEPVGRGAYGEVMRAELKSNGQEYAIKIVSKAKLKRENKTKYAHVEKNLLTRLRHPGIIRLYFAFQDQMNLYYATEFCPGGELLNYINCYAGHFSLQLAKFYTAEIINVLEYLHSEQIAHRDLKPENLLLTVNGHLKLIDFGTARDYKDEAETNDEAARSRRSTFVGTAEYVSPEVLNDGDSGPAVDLWALGCIVYQLIVGKPPFKAANEYLIFERIREGYVDYPSHMPLDARDLIQNLLKVDPTQRLGAGLPGTPNSYEALKAHPFFEGLNVDTIFDQTVPNFAMIDRISSDDLEIKLLNSGGVTVMPKPPETIYEGFVDKKAGWIFRKRKLVISSQPRISYWHPTKEQMKGEISLGQTVVAAVTGRCNFTIKVPTRTYYFKTLNGEPPHKWVELVNKLIADYFPSCFIQMAYLFNPYQVSPCKSAKLEKPPPSLPTQRKEWYTKVKLLRPKGSNLYSYGYDGALEQNPTAFASYIRPPKRSSNSFDMSYKQEKKRVRTRLKLATLPAASGLKTLKSAKDSQQKRPKTPNVDGRVFVTLDGITLQPGEKLPGFRYTLPKDRRQTRQIDTRLFYIMCKEKLGVLDDLTFMFDTNGKSYNYIDEIPRSAKTILVSTRREFTGIKLVPSKSLFNDSEDEVQLPFKSRLNTSVTRSSRRNKSHANISSSNYEEIELERISKNPFLSSPENSFDLLNDPVFKPPSRASTSTQVVRPKKKSSRQITPASKLKVDYVKANINSVGTIRSVINAVEKRFPPLSLMNIPLMMEKYDFTRVQLHHLYAQYKSMLVAACAADSDYNLREGVDKTTFIAFSRNGASVFGKELSEKVFDTIDRNKNGTADTGYIDWHEYLTAMSIINVGTSETKIELFFNMYDKNKNGRLDYSEIKNVCKLQLKPNADDPFIDDMSDFFTKLLFRISGVSEDEEMEAGQLKKALLNDTEARNLVELFCCWHNNL